MNFHLLMFIFYAYTREYKTSSHSEKKSRKITSFFSWSHCGIKCFYAAISAQWTHSRALKGILEEKNSLNETIQINHIVRSEVS